MIFRTLFSNRRTARRLRSRTNATQRSVSSVPFEQLESRAMLAGNVTAQLIGQSAFINGDAADNSVQVLVEGGNVVVRGADGTTVNGSTNDFVLATGTSQISGSIFARLSNGNDNFAVNGVTVGRHVSINGGRGNDRIVLTNSIVNRNVAMAGSSGNDVLVVSTTSIGRHLSISGGGGSDDIVIDDSQIGQDARLRGGSGDDDIVVRNSQIGDDLAAATHRGNDMVMIDASSIGDRSRIAGGTGSDNVVIQGTSSFGNKMRAHGGPGSDNFQRSDEVVFNRTKRRSFSGSTVDANLIDTRITSATTGALAAAEAAIAQFDTGFSIAVDNAIFSENAGNGAATLTVSRGTRDSTNALEVTLTATPAGQTKLTLSQSTVTIPAGQASATVTVNAVDDSEIDADTVVTITATAPEQADATVQITVTNDDSAALTLTTTDTQFPEDTGSPTTTGQGQTIPVTIARTGNTDAALVVSLETPNGDRLVVPSTVTIPAGDLELEFNITTIRDDQVDPNNTVVTLNATATGHTQSQIQLTLVDTDAPALLVGFDRDSISEDSTAPDGSASARFTVRRNTAPTAPLTVSLAADPANKVQLSSSTLTIPAGQSEAFITVTGIQNLIDDGDIAVAITATAEGFTPGSETLTVLDDDDPRLFFTLTSSEVVAENAGSGAVTATFSRNTSDTSAPVEVTIQITGDTRLTGPSTVTIPAGQMEVEDVSFDVVDNNQVEADPQTPVAITISAPGFQSATEVISITDNDIATITLPDDFSVDENSGTADIVVTRNSSATAETVAFAYSDASFVSGPATLQFAAGELTKTLTVNISDNGSFQDNNDATITASAPGHADVTVVISVDNDDILTLTTEVSSNAAGQPVEQSVEGFVTKASSITVSGVTAPGATVQIESDGDGDFGEQSQTAETDGSYSFSIPLTHDATNLGANVFQVRALIPSETVEQTSAPIDVHRAVGTVVRFQINQDLDQNGSNDFYDVELLDTAAPLTVANFLSYVNDSSYQNTFVHNSTTLMENNVAVVQAGEFTVSNSVVGTVVEKTAIANEFAAANSNVRGTLSAALAVTAENGADPASATSGFFVNTADNSAILDADEYTVFGRVIAGGLDVADDFNAPGIDLALVTGQNDLFGSTTPLANSPLTRITGTVSFDADSTTLVGNGTLFTTELQVGSILVEPSSARAQLVVTAINSDTELVVDVETARSESQIPLDRLDPPADSDFVIFSNIGEILGSM